MDREKVIEDLEWAINDEDVFDALYVDDLDGVVDTMRDALELLKAQEPRVMTLEDLRAVGDVWQYNTPPYLWKEVNPNIRLTTSFWCAWRDVKDMLLGLYPKYTDENYGTEWRCWTSRPTDKQREATPWPT